MRELVSGNTYTNETYGFQMYKPPAWKVIEGAQTLLPGSITAMGTDDQTTYLLIGQEPAGKSLASDIEAKLSLPTKISGSMNRGKLEIRYSSREELERVCAKLV